MMNFGMLWLDDDHRASLVTKVDRAAAYYQRKYGQAANFCLVHPSMLAQPYLRTGRVLVRAHRSIQPDCFWIGLDDGGRNSFPLVQDRQAFLAVDLLSGHS
jgi:hypothetical protein